MDIDLYRPTERERVMHPPDYKLEPMHPKSNVLVIVMVTQKCIQRTEQFTFSYVLGFSSFKVTVLLGIREEIKIVIYI